MSIRGLGKAAALAVLACAALPGTAFGALELTVTPAPVHSVTGDKPTITATVKNTGATTETEFAILFSPQDQGLTVTPTGNIGCVDFVVLACPIDSLDPGQSVTASVTYGTLKPDSASLMVNVNAGGNPSFLWQTTVTPPAKLGLSLAAQTPSFTAGNTTSITATVSNTGSGPAYDAALRLNLPFGLSPESIPGACSAVGLALTCALGDLPSQESAAVTVPLKPPQIGFYTVLGTASWARPPTSPADLGISVLAPVGPDDGSGGLPTDASGASTPAEPKTVTLERITRGLPGRNRCVRGRVFDVLLRSSGEVDPKSAVVRIDRKVVKRLKGAKARAPFTIRVPRPRSRRFVLRLSVTLGDGRIFNASRTYVVCRRR